MIKIIEKPNLPEDITKGSVATTLLAQAVRVFLANQRQGTQSALTRAGVARTRKKVYKQKGTGHARHGDKRAPIFVGGGIAFAPKPRDHRLGFSPKMKLMAKNGALSQKNKDNQLIVVSGLESVSGKTSVMAKFLATLSDKTSNYLLLTNGLNSKVARSAKNLEMVEIDSYQTVTAYQIMRADKVIIMEEVFK